MTYGGKIMSFYFGAEYGASIFINIHFLYEMLLLSLPVKLLEHMQVYSNKSE